MPGPAIDTLPQTDTIPRQVDAVVIGGGVIGLFTALELRERGLSVALCEKGPIGAEQSSRNWGWVRVARRDSREIALAIEARALWEQMEHRLQRAVGYTQRGIVFAAHSEADQHRQAAWLEMAKPYDSSISLLGKHGLEKHFNGATVQARSALFSPKDGSAEPQLVAIAAARACRQSGVHVLPACAVRSVETQAGRAHSVVTETGEIRCDSVVLAAGGWSSLFLRNMGVELPQLKVLSSVLRTEPSQHKLDHALWTSDFAVRQKTDGSLTVASGHKSVADIVPDSFRYCRQFLPTIKQEWRSVSLRLGPETVRECKQPTHWGNDSQTPFEQTRTLDPKPRERHPMTAFNAMKKAIPSFADLRVAQTWAGLIDVTPDAIPIISGIDDRSGVFIATGFSGHGFGVAPAAGKLMAQIVCSQQPVVDPQAFRLSRFSDGSLLTL